MKIAYVCYAAREKYLADSMEDEEGILLRHLQQAGLNVQREIWTDKKVKWASYDLLLIKSPWDYFEKYTAFCQWLDKVKQLGIRMLNPLSIIKWNSDKHYLNRISTAGFPVIPFAFIEKEEMPLLSSFFFQFATAKIIVKPCVSGGARHTFTVTPDNLNAMQTQIAQLVKDEAFVVQPFVKEIVEGEWSFIFLNGQYSHTVLKKPKSGDFRVQAYFGGSVQAMEPSSALLQQAEAFVQQFAKGCLYARVDGVLIKDQLQLMELELIEPYLFLGSHPAGYQRYVQALQAMIAQVTL